MNESAKGSMPWRRRLCLGVGPLAIFPPRTPPAGPSIACGDFALRHPWSHQLPQVMEGPEGGRGGWDTFLVGNIICESGVMPLKSDACVADSLCVNENRNVMWIKSGIYGDGSWSVMAQVTWRGGGRATSIQPCVPTRLHLAQSRGRCHELFAASWQGCLCTLAIRLLVRV